MLGLCLLAQARFARTTLRPPPRPPASASDIYLLLARKDGLGAAASGLRPFGMRPPLRLSGRTFKPALWPLGGVMSRLKGATVNRKRLNGRAVTRRLPAPLPNGRPPAGLASLRSLTSASGPPFDLVGGRPLGAVLPGFHPLGPATRLAGRFPHDSLKGLNMPRGIISWNYFILFGFFLLLEYSLG